MDINKYTVEEILEQIGESRSNIEQDSAAKPKAEVRCGSESNEEVLPQPRVEFPSLQNPFEPNAVIDHEKIEHRAVLLLKCTGMTNAAIAAELGYTPVHVGSIVNQPWAQQFMLGRIHGTADKAMKALQEESEAAALRLIKLSRESKNDETKRKANNDILDRKYGKPNQPYSHTEKPVADLTDAELAKFVPTSEARSN